MDKDIPPHLADLFNRVERFKVLDNEQEAVHAYIAQSLTK